MALKCAASSTPIDPEIEIPGTYATGTLPLGPLWVSDVPGVVLGPSFGLLGLKTRKERLFLHSPVYLHEQNLTRRRVRVPPWLSIHNKQKILSNNSKTNRSPGYSSISQSSRFIHATWYHDDLSMLMSSRHRHTAVADLKHPMDPDS